MNTLLEPLFPGLRFRGDPRAMRSVTVLVFTAIVQSITPQRACPNNAMPCNGVETPWLINVDRCDKFSILSLLMGDMGSWGRAYVKRMYVRGTWPVSHSITSSPQPPVTGYRKPPGGPGGGGGRPSSFPRKEAPGGSCDRMRSDAPSPAAGDFPGPGQVLEGVAPTRTH